MPGVRVRLPRLTALLLAGSLGLAACGTAGDGGNAAGNGTDRAFINAMVPHHEMAIEMAKIAQARGRRAEIKKLAAEIIRGQRSEIFQLNLIKHDLQGVKPSSLGIPSDMKGMGPDMDMAVVRNARPFDRGFIDVMIPHHQGAIRMAYVELAKGRSPALLKIATDILNAQSTEITAMNEWRTSWYGRPSPAGGIPSKSDVRSEHSGHSM